MTTPEEPGAPAPTGVPSAEQGRSGQLALIRAVLTQSPELRLAGLRRAATFFKGARRV